MTVGGTLNDNRNAISEAHIRCFHAVVVTLLYAPCRWYAQQERTQTNEWLRYL